MITKDQIEEAVKQSTSIHEVARMLNLTGIPNLIRRCNKYSVDVSHLKIQSRVKLAVKKTCPVCQKKFQGIPSVIEKKTTCSHACANKWFRTGENNGNWNKDRYRTTCFLFHEKACVICKEDKIVEVHHLDGDHYNNNPENLIPLCPTHHQYWHSQYRHIIYDSIMQYVNDFNIPVD